MYIPQKQLDNLSHLISPQKAIVVYGPRRCGKTTLLKRMLEKRDEDALFVDGEDIIVQGYLSSQSIEKLKSFVGRNKLLVIDEAQKVKNIGLNIKLILDNIEGIKVVASGSSSFDLAQQLGEPLTGRKYTLKMFPISQMELSSIEERPETDALLESRLIFGSYPEVVLIKDDARRKLYLKEIVSSYLYKDVLELEGIKYADKLVRLLQLLAFQVGKEVSCTELGSQLEMSKNTVERYLDLLEKAFVIFKLSGFSRNLRKEISKSSRYYFLDVGVRNALINNFNPLSMRDDLGMLWENYIVIERIKRQNYLLLSVNNYFWRTHDKKEIDLVEEYDGKLFGYEIKFSKKNLKPPKLWSETYKNSEFEVINKENYLDFICK